MRLTGILVAAVLLAVVVLVIVLLLPTSGEAAQRPSVFSRSARGLLAARQYLESRGVQVESWDKPLSDLPAAPGVLVVACPLAAPFSYEDAEAAREWVLRGGSIVLLSSGDRPDPRELGLFLAHDLGHVRTREDPPLRWSAWKEWRLADERLTSLAAPGEEEPPRSLVVLAGTHAVSRPGGARDLFFDEGGTPKVFELRRGKGRVVVVNNSTLWSNGWIARAGNASFLARVTARLTADGGKVLFDEWHQGVRVVSGAARSAVVTPFELLVAHGALIYLAAVWTLSRRFGPKMRSSPPRGRPGAAALMSLAELHHRSGHAPAAGRRLVEVARRRARRAGDAEEEIPVAFEGGVRELRRLARRIGELQREHRL